MRRSTVMSLLFVAGVAAPALAEEVSPAEAQATFRAFCSRCHGVEGHGDGPGAAELTPKPRNFTDCRLMATKKDDQLVKVITEGGAAAGLSANMAAWGRQLSPDEIRALVRYVRTFCRES